VPSIGHGEDVNRLRLVIRLVHAYTERVPVGPVRPTKVNLAWNNQFNDAVDTCFTLQLQYYLVLVNGRVLKPQGYLVHIRLF